MGHDYRAPFNRDNEPLVIVSNLNAPVCRGKIVFYMRVAPREASPFTPAFSTICQLFGEFGDNCGNWNSCENLNIRV